MADNTAEKQPAGAIVLTSPLDFLRSCGWRIERATGWQAGFDYAAIDADGRDDVKEAAVRIRLRMSRTVEDIIEIGRDLKAVKAAIGHGNYIRWIEAEFGIGERTAQRFVVAFDRFGGNPTRVTGLSANVLYALAKTGELKSQGGRQTLPPRNGVAGRHGERSHNLI